MVQSPRRCFHRRSPAAAPASVSLMQLPYRLWNTSRISSRTAWRRWPYRWWLANDSRRRSIRDVFARMRSGHFDDPQWTNVLDERTPAPLLIAAEAASVGHGCINPCCQIARSEIEALQPTSLTAASTGTDSIRISTSSSVGIVLRDRSADRNELCRERIVRSPSRLRTTT
jgi:hypothetical protein